MRRLAAPRSARQMSATAALAAKDRFAPRHLGPRESDYAAMLETVGVDSIDEMVRKTVPSQIMLQKALDLGKYSPGLSESDALVELKRIAGKNKINRSFIGMGYYDTKTPAVILRNVLENPGWYTQYTPYQPEVAQGRLESLMNFQTMVSDLTGFELSNASLLDESTAAAEAMSMIFAGARKKPKFFVDKRVHPQTLAVVQTRADGLGCEVVTGDFASYEFGGEVCGALLQYPATDGSVHDYTAFTAKAKAAGAKVAVATDLLGLTVLQPPAMWGADIAVGSAQRFGVPLGYGGPHAGFLSTSPDMARKMPGRIIGMSIDAHGKPAYRMAMQTREQHIRRDKATSNICTAQALLANVSALYAMYHGPEGLKQIANHCQTSAALMLAGLKKIGCTAPDTPFFDTICVTPPAGVSVEAVLQAGYEQGVNFRKLSETELTLSCDETTSIDDIAAVWTAFGLGKAPAFSADDMMAEAAAPALPSAKVRTALFMTHPVFSSHQSEHQMLRYLFKLANKDLSLVHCMVPLGSCTMKLNSTAEMMPITWPEINRIHPYAPAEQTVGYAELITSMEDILCEITGFPGMSLQPNSGASGEYAGLRAIRSYQADKGEAHRDVCLIPVSAHGTNPASAAMCGMRIVAIGCDDQGNVDMADLKAKAEKHKDKLSALMVTYPSTHGVFEETIVEICDLVHDAGGQVYMDGANMNAQVGLCGPGYFGADVCHLNLHKTFCIPHGGGGPGVGPIGVAEHLKPHLPGHPIVPMGGDVLGGKAFGTVAGAPWGSASILPISWMYCVMMGSEGLRNATETAILNANYMAARLSSHYQVLYTGKAGLCAHEFILDLREFKASAGVTESDVAKRLADYNFHAPTMSWPVAGTIMVEPTESEDKAELDRFCDALISIRAEIAQIEQGLLPQDDNPLKNAPHTQAIAIADKWERPYSRTVAVYPVPGLKQNKFWPTTSRVNDTYGDRNLVCSCPPVEAFAEQEEEAAM